MMEEIAEKASWFFVGDRTLQVMFFGERRC